MAAITNAKTKNPRVDADHTSTSICELKVNMQMKFIGPTKVKYFKVLYAQGRKSFVDRNSLVSSSPNIPVHVTAADGKIK
jgi:hypothetical protein